MAFQFLLLLVAAVIIGSTVLLRRTRRNILLERLRAGGRRVSGARTPPRSLSPDKKPEASTTVDYSQSLPPSRRSALAEILNDEDIDEPVGDWAKNILPMETSYLDADDSARLPCGFSIKEVKALGDFPDYAALSGVPLPAPYPEFDIDKALPRPYRPFRWPYHQTMSLTKLQPDWWLELESTYKARIQQRKTLYAQHGTDVLNALPGSELACKEIMEMALQFLCTRYPHYFHLSPNKQTFYNSILSTETNLSTTPPLHVLLENVPEDFAIMQRSFTTGRYVLRAGVICSAIGWNLGTKINKHLSEIHTPIPDYKEKMEFSMERFFTKMASFSPIQRGSWGLEVDEPLYIPPESMHSRFPAKSGEKEKEKEVELGIDRIHLRVDWQTLRRIPLSGAIVFNFKALFTPVESFRHEPHIPALLLKIMQDGKKSLLEYKGTSEVENVVLPKLKEWHEEQVGKGWVEEGWQEETLRESPWYEGWEGKWRAEQGF